MKIITLFEDYGDIIKPMFDNYDVMSMVKIDISQRIVAEYMLGCELIFC